MKQLRKMIRNILLENASHEAKLAKLLTSPLPQAVQGAQLGEPIDLVRDFDHFPLPFDQAHIVTVKTPQTLADLIRKEVKRWQHLTQIPQEDGWVESSYAIPESFN